MSTETKDTKSKSPKSSRSKASKVAEAAEDTKVAKATEVACESGNCLTILNSEYKVKPISALIGTAYPRDADTLATRLENALKNYKGTVVGTFTCQIGRVPTSFVVTLE